MNIDIDGGKIIITLEEETLKIRHRTQLNFWHFVSSKNGYISELDDNDLVFKVKDYFEEKMD